MSEVHDVVVVGGGQAGLVASHALTERGIDHVVFERDRAGGRWRTERWDSLRFQFPNTVLGLPGMPYDGREPDGYAHYREVLQRVERYATVIRAPIREHTPVLSLEQGPQGWRVTTPQDVIRCRAVVLSTGPFQRARVPPASATLPADVHQIHSTDYRSPDLLPDGAVLVVGSGASGAQIAEDLLAAGRTTYLCVSRHRRVPRRFLGRDVFTWLVEIGLMNRTRADWVDGRMPPTVLVTGVGGGHDMNLRQLEQGAAAARHPARRHGRSGESGRRRGADTDRRRHHVRPDRYPTTPSIRKAGITSVIWSIGYSYDYDWVHAPCLDSSGQPLQQRSVGQVPLTRGWVGRTLDRGESSGCGYLGHRS